MSQSSDLESKIVRSLPLSPEDWQVATWRSYSPCPKPQVEPFDRSAVIERLKLAFVPLQGTKPPHQRYSIEWNHAKLSPVLSQEEAKFWFTTITHSFDNVDAGTEELLSFLTTIADYSKPLEIEEIVSTLIWSDHRTWLKPEIVPAIVAFCPLEEVFSRLVDLSLLTNEQLFSYAELHYSVPEFLRSQNYNPEMPREYALPQIAEKIRVQISSLLNSVLTPGFRQYVIPYLSNQEIEGLQQKFAPIFARASLSIASLPYYLAYKDQWIILLTTSLRIYDRIQAYVEQASNPQPYAIDLYQIVFGLQSAELVETHIRRLQLFLMAPEHMKAWLAHTEFQGLDWVRDSILKANKKEQALRLFEVFAGVKAPEAAPHMLKLMLESKVPQQSRQWLEENPEHTIAGLVPITSGDSKLAQAAISFLRSLKDQGYDRWIEAAILNSVAEIRNKIKAQVLNVETQPILTFDGTNTPRWLYQGVMELQRSKSKTLPDWIALPDLPAIKVGEYHLRPDQTIALLLALKQSTLTSPHPFTVHFKQHGQRETIDAFVWRLFELWTNEGAPSKDKWAMLSLGVIGSDAVAFKLVPVIRRLPGENQHQRAIVGLECLRAIGTDAAIMQIHGLAQTLKFRALKKRAQECLHAIAKDRNLSFEQLEDRIVPTLDLDNPRSFNFGTRQFEFVLKADLKPMIRDSTGKLKADLPKPGLKDDAELAATAIADWKLLKKQLSEVFKIQRLRLENAMAIERYWSIDEFETLLVHHPLMIHFAQRLLWAGYNSNNEMLKTFRVAEDCTFTNVHDESTDLIDLTHVGIAHPIQLSPDLKSEWANLFLDYEILSPFSQLDRQIYSLEPQEQQVIRRFKTFNQNALGQRPGWSRNSPYDNYDDPSLICWKQFPKANVTAIVGCALSDSIECRFEAGLKTYTDFPRHAKDWGLPLDSINPIAISEVIRDLTITNLPHR